MLIHKNEYEVKIVVSTKDGKRISRTFSGCNLFRIYETRDGKIVNKITKPNTYNSRIRQKLEMNDQRHPGRDLVDGMKDCDVIICHRMNRRNWINMGGSGKEMIFTSMTDAENAVIKYLSGELKDEYHRIMNF